MSQQYDKNKLANEVQINYNAFCQMKGGGKFDSVNYYGKIALFRNAAFIEIFEDRMDAHNYALQRYPDGIYSMQTFGKKASKFVPGKFSHDGRMILEVKIGNPFNSNNGTDLEGCVCKVKAVIDTGANISCISKSIADNYKLRLDELTLLKGTNNREETNSYTVSLFIPETNYYLEGLKVAEAKALQCRTDFQVILGMDAFKRGTLNIDFDSRSFELQLPPK